MGSSKVSLLSDVSCSYIPRRHYFPIALLCEKSPFHSRLSSSFPPRAIVFPTFFGSLGGRPRSASDPKNQNGFVCLSLRGGKFFNRFRARGDTFAPGHSNQILGLTSMCKCKKEPLSSAELIISACTFPISQG